MFSLDQWVVKRLVSLRTAGKTVGVDCQISGGFENHKGLGNLNYETRDHFVEQPCAVPTRFFLFLGALFAMKDGDFELEA